MQESKIAEQAQNVLYSTLVWEWLKKIHRNSCALSAVTTFQQTQESKIAERAHCLPKFLIDT